MDPRTLDYYQLHAREVAARYDAVPSPLALRLASCFPAGQRILDVGCGSGRDLACLLRCGYDAYGAEPVAGLAAQCVATYPESAGRIAQVGLPDLGQPFGGAFDGVVCNAVLMHLPDATLFDSALAIKAVLREGGRLLLTVSEPRPGLDASQRDRDGRLFSETTPAQYQLLFERLGFQVLDRWADADSLGRSEIRWTTVLLVLHDHGAVRPVDQEEAQLKTSFPDPATGGRTTPADRFDLSYPAQSAGECRRVELPFVTAVFADLLGMPTEAAEPVEARRFIRIDIESFDAVMARFAPRLLFEVPDILAGSGHVQFELTLRCMADFEPGHWMRRIDSLSAALDACEAAAPAERARMRDLLDRQASLICGHPAFRQLEAAWRGLHRLVARTGPEDALPILVMSLNKRELAKALKRYKGSAWKQGPVFRQLWSEGIGNPGANPVGCVVVDFEFDLTPQDIETLGELGKIGAECRAPIIAAAAPMIMHLDSWSELHHPQGPAAEYRWIEQNLGQRWTRRANPYWRSLRQHEDSRHLVLTMPRYRGRPPYGAEAQESATYTFREQVNSRHDWLWCNPAYLLAENVHRSLRRTGWFSQIHGVIADHAAQATPPEGPAGRWDGPLAMCPLEAAIPEERAAELANEGIAAITVSGPTGQVAFASLPTLHRPAEYHDAEATRNARQQAELSCVLATGRLAHCVNAISRDILPGLADVVQVREWLSRWIADYVDAKTPGREVSASRSRPFAWAEFQVEESPDAPGGFRVTFQARPNVQTP